MSRQQPTAQEQDLVQRLGRMLMTGRRYNLSVDLCIRMVRFDRRLEAGAYDRLLDQYGSIEQSFTPTAAHTRHWKPLGGRDQS